jgi:hypothetical protein
VDGGAQQGLQHWQQGVGLVEGKSSVGHEDTSILAHRAGFRGWSFVVAG